MSAAEAESESGLTGDYAYQRQRQLRLVIFIVVGGATQGIGRAKDRLGRALGGVRASFMSCFVFPSRWKVESGTSGVVGMIYCKL